MNPVEPRPPTSSSSSGEPEAGRRLGERAQELGDSAQELWSQARGLLEGLNQALDLPGRIERHPYATLAAAAGVGYVLAGGLFTPLTAKVVRLGLRLGALPLVRAELWGLAGLSAPESEDA